MYENFSWCHLDILKVHLFIRLYPQTARLSCWIHEFISSFQGLSVWLVLRLWLSTPTCRLRFRLANSPNCLLCTLFFPLLVDFQLSCSALLSAKILQNFSRQSCTLDQPFLSTEQLARHLMLKIQMAYSGITITPTAQGGPQCQPVCFWFH